MVDIDKNEATLSAAKKFPLHFSNFRRRLINCIGFILYAIAMIFVAVSAWAAIANVIRSGWNSDAAAWIQAAGSIAAIAGSTWIAQSEARRARRVRREQNEEAAWYVRFAIKQAQFESQIIAAELLNRNTPVETNDVREWRQRATTSIINLNAFLERTDHVHPSVTHALSNAKVLMDYLIEDLAILNQKIDHHKQPDRDLIGRIAAPHKALLEIIDLYDNRMRGVRKILDDENDTLPIKSWAPWNSDHP